MDTWTVVGLTGLLVVILLLPVVIIRWVFRVNKKIGLLTEIRDQLKTHEDDQSEIRNQKSYCPGTRVTITGR